MTITLADRTDWRAGLGNAVQPTNLAAHQYMSGLSVGGSNISSRFPTIFGLAGTGSLVFSAIVALPSHTATASPATEWHRWSDDATRRAAEAGYTAGKELAQNIRRLSGLTNEEIAPLTGVSRRSFQAWLAGSVVSARKEMRLRQIIDALELIGETDSQKMRATLLRREQGGIRPYDLLAEGRFDAAVSLATGRRSGVTKSRTSQAESVAQQFDRDQRSLPNTGGRLNRRLSKSLRW
jgi:hypothetical protein